jgi:glyoxylase-like metal-dependent hydrolase (beta-lactamase superfamily II)
MAKIFPLSEGTFTIAADKVFRPFNPDTEDLNERPVGSLTVEVQPFLVITNEDYILLDTGLGFALPNGVLQIHNNLHQLGIDSSQITKVILTHLHKDHAGGISYFNKKGEQQLSFPNATYFVYQPEYEYAVANDGKSYILEEFKILADHKNVHFYSEESGWLSHQIQHQLSGGHCKNHQVIWIHDGDDIIFFGGDEAPQIKQLKFKYIAKYDFDGKRASELREQYVIEGKKNNWEFCFYHDMKLPTSRL